jgi:tripartite-type tricarboxylate transporter receptor subunit TctC
MVIPWPPGGTNDIIGRALADPLGRVLNQQVIVDNRGGSNGVIGAEAVARAPGDGYTIMFHSITSHATNPAVYKKLGYDTINDFTPITQIAWLHAAIVKVLHTPQFKERLDFEGASQPIGNTPEQMAAAVKADVGKLAKLVRAAGLTPQYVRSE